MFPFLYLYTSVGRRRVRRNGEIKNKNRELDVKLHFDILRNRRGTLKGGAVSSLAPEYFFGPTPNPGALRFQNKFPTPQTTCGFYRRRRGQGSRIISKRMRHVRAHVYRTGMNCRRANVRPAYALCGVARDTGTRRGLEKKKRRREKPE